MDEENKQEETGQEEPKGAEAEPKDEASKGDDGSKADEAPKGATVNRRKHERDLEKLQGRIDELEAENKSLKAKGDGVAALEKRLDDMEAKAKAEKVEAALKAAGCHNVKAALACLDDHDGDIGKLKEACPYLFNSADSSKSTGGNQKGKAGGSDEDEKLDRAFGLK